MNPDLASLVQQFTDLVWQPEAPDLSSHEEQFRRACTGVGSLDAILTELADESLALAVKRNVFRKPAFAMLLHDRYESRLVDWFVGFGCDRESAFDLTQELYLKLYRSQLGAYDPEQPFQPYLFVAARRLWIDKVARASRQTAQLSDEGDRPAAPSADATLLRELEEAIELALQRVPASLREVLQMSMDRAVPAEIARVLGRPIKTIYQQLHKGRQRLAEQLGIPYPQSGRGRPSA